MVAAGLIIASWRAARVPRLISAGGAAKMASGLVTGSIGWSVGCDFGFITESFYESLRPQNRTESNADQARLLTETGSARTATRAQRVEAL